MLKQVALFSAKYDITTCGFGEAPAGVVAHHKVPDGYTAAKPYSRLLRFGLFRLAYWRQSAARWARRALRGGVWDAVMANDPESLPLAFALAPRSIVHADLHEYSPRMREHLSGWSRIYRPYYEWLCRRFAARAASVTTVSRGIVDEYRRSFGIEPGLVTNAAPRASLQPGAVRSPLKLVHSGRAMPHRGLEQVIEAVGMAGGSAVLDLYLVGAGSEYYELIRERVEATPGVELRDAVSTEQLVSALNGYDVGVHLLQPVNFNHVNALPNKVFDYVQARLALIVGPSPEMARLVREYGIGWVTDDFTSEALAATIAELSPDDVHRAKAASHAASAELSSEAQDAVWSAAISEIVASGARS